RRLSVIRQLHGFHTDLCSSFFVSLPFFFHGSLNHRYLHSFPTRRSSDLVHLPVVGGGELKYVTEVFNDMVARLRESRRGLERLSVTDDLTGLYNRRYVMDTLANEVRRSRRLDHPCALLMADVDHFKEYNDAYGHLAGD